MNGNNHHYENENEDDDEDEYEEVEVEVEVDEDGNEFIVDQKVLNGNHNGYHIVNGNGSLTNHVIKDVNGNIINESEIIQGDGDEDEEYEEIEVEIEEEYEEEEEEEAKNQSTPGGDSKEIEEIEPILKYNRLAYDITEILKKDAASCMAVHPKFLVLGTHWGSVSIHDFEGNEIKKFDCHTTTITELVIDPTGDYIASCSDDGKIVINPFDSKTGEIITFNSDRPISALALDPEFSKKNNRQLVSGGKSGQLLLKEKGWFRYKETIIHQGEGPIYAIKWSGLFIAWANDKGVKIYDCSTNTKIAHIPREEGAPRGELYRCCLCWEKANTLIIGWAKSVEVIQIIDKIDSLTGNTVKTAQMMNKFQTHYWISGIAPFGEELVILGYNDINMVEGFDDPNSQSATPKMLAGTSSPNSITGAWNQGRVESAAKPSIHIVSRKTNQSITTDHLSVNGFSHYKATDYRLDYNTDENIFYIVCPKDVVAAKPRNVDDHLAWLISKLKYDEALEEVEKDQKTLKILPPTKIKEIGEKYIEHLLERKEIRKAASLCPKICQKDPDLWEKWILRFYKIGGIQLLCPHIPIGNPSLSCTVYEMFLNHFLKQDPAMFLETVTNWPSNIYNIQTIITTAEEYLSKHQNETIMIALAKLYTYENSYEKTLDIYLKLKKGNVFDLINQHEELYNSIQNKVVAFIDFNQQEAIKVLVANTDKITIGVVVAQLSSKQEYLHHYLHNLFLKDAHIAEEFHELQISLYAQYEPSLLLHFLKNSFHYSLEKALEICKKKNLYEEMVFLLGRIGNSKEALNLILDKLGNIKDAVEFVEQQQDADLWEYFISKSMNNSSYISELLENIGSNVDPIKLIRLIPEKMEIKNLRNRLVKILSDYNLQMSLREGCKEILKSDCVFLAEALFDSLRMGRVAEEYSKCATCSQPITVPKPDCSIVLYFCNHTYHSRCLKVNEVDDPNSQNQPQKQQQQQISSNTEFIFGCCPICFVQNNQSKLITKGTRKIG
ncbi:RING zinc finger-containing protein [Tieghemostelium lacteum]|uniref:RING zinc finger-containing protein n=1 Tax=Tieghemostelium lacteum TaxID=361077 RepID=A0A152A2E6_TIELA|nr:RING zinc finger-containing protein [Tieghemostelium lacteum]|eukprot:KYR00389.1 RING zinc finger-containing protein [Tieghemostelium lacteum]